MRHNLELSKVQMGLELPHGMLYEPLGTSWQMNSEHHTTHPVSYTALELSPRETKSSSKEPQEMYRDHWRQSFLITLSTPTDNNSTKISLLASLCWVLDFFHQKRSGRISHAGLTREFSEEGKGNEAMGETG